MLANFQVLDKSWNNFFKKKSLEKKWSKQWHTDQQSDIIWHYLHVKMTFTKPSGLQSISLSQITVNSTQWDLLSPRSSWEQERHVSSVALPIKRSQCWMRTSPQRTMATAVKMSNARPKGLQREEFQWLNCYPSKFSLWFIWYRFTIIYNP